jgi:CIC family chloride channel protein
MGVLFAAFLRVPLTSVFMVLEVSGNYSIVLPVILANTIAYLVSRSLQPYPIFETFTHQDGLDLPSMEEQREESVLHLEDALRPVNVADLSRRRHPAGGLCPVGCADAPVLLVKLRDGSWYSMNRSEYTSMRRHKPRILCWNAPSNRIGRRCSFLTCRWIARFPTWRAGPFCLFRIAPAKGTLEGVVSLEDVLGRYQQQ